MTEKRPFGTRLIDYFMGRSTSELDQNEAGRDDIKFNNKVVEKTMDKVFDTQQLVVSTVNDFNTVLEQLAKDLGYVDKRKRRGQGAKAAGRAHKS